MDMAQVPSSTFTFWQKKGNIPKNHYCDFSFDMTLMPNILAGICVLSQTYNHSVSDVKVITIGIHYKN